MSKKEHPENISPFAGPFTGGPHGLGDPEDRSMRRLEEQFINQMVKDHAHHTVCKQKVYGNVYFDMMLIMVQQLANG